MAAKLKFSVDGEGHRWVTFICPSPVCGDHGVPVDGPRKWNWNGSLDKPTLTPSLRVTWNWGQQNYCCHFNITDGQIQFHGDCTHHLRNTTLPMADIVKENTEAMSTTTTPPTPSPTTPPDPNPTTTTTETPAEANSAVAGDITADIASTEAFVESPTVQAAKNAMWQASATARQRLHQLLEDIETAEKVDLTAARKVLGV